MAREIFFPNNKQGRQECLTWLKEREKELGETYVTVTIQEEYDE